MTANVQGSNILDVLKKKMRATKEECEKFKEEAEDLQRKLQVEINRREDVIIQCFMALFWSILGLFWPKSLDFAQCSIWPKKIVRNSVTFFPGQFLKSGLFGLIFTLFDVDFWIV